MIFAKIAVMKIFKFSEVYNILGEKMKGCMNCVSGNASGKIAAIIFAALGVFFLVDGFFTHGTERLVQAFISYLLAFVFFGIAKMCVCSMSAKPKARKRRRR